MTRLPALATALAVLAGTAAAQGPDADWNTLRTNHFRVHYTTPDEPWARRVSSRLEAIRERVTAEVGYAPTDVVDVVVSNPMAQPNGEALPILGAPRMVLWTTPPAPESALGSFTDWAELLALHEDVHNVHLLRPSRNPWRHLAEALLPVGPITTKAPRWVHEGYATLLEGELTGAGRPNGDLRASVLRRWAQLGRLPSYSRMSSDAQSFMGMSMAYLMGSAYLEWLVERSGPDSLRHLWARLTARTDRGFEAAFEGVFGDAPERLYGRFTAELTWRAIEVERALVPAREGELWQDLSWATGEPTISPDGQLLATVLRSRQKASRMVVWSTAPDDEGERKWQDQVNKALARDGADVAPARSKPLPRKPLHELVTHNGAEPSALRFAPDGRSLLYVRFEPDGQGFLHPDIFRWSFLTGRVERITHLADLRWVDPAPDGAWAVAVRVRHGATQLVRVDLTGGTITAITEPDLDDVLGSPRVSPDGRRVVFPRNRAGAWHLVVRSLADGSEVVLPAPEGTLLAQPAWTRNGYGVLASMGHEGLIDIVHVPADGSGAPGFITRSAAACAAPAPAPDGAGVYFLALEPDGLDLRRVALESTSAASPDEPTSAALPPRTATSHQDPDAALAPAVRPSPPPRTAPLRVEEVPAGRDYGLGRQELQGLAGGRSAASGESLELGLRAGDVVGRFSAVALGAVGHRGGASGAMAAAAWRGWPVTVEGHLFASRERPSDQDDAGAASDELLDAERTGLELAASWQRVWRATRLQTSGGLLASRIEPRHGASVAEQVGFLAVSLSRQPSRRPWRLVESIEAGYQAGRTDGQGWWRLGGHATIGVARGSTGLALTWQRHTLGGTPARFDLLQLGGLPDSLLPDSATAGRIAAPALPAALLVGTNHEGQRGELTLLGVPLFFERHRVWDDDHGPWLRLAGLELDLAGDPYPLLKLPGFHVRLGAARILDEPLKDTNRFWFSLAWEP